MKQRIQHMLWLNILPDLITFSFFYYTGGTRGLLEHRLFDCEF